MSADEVLRRLADHARGTIEDFVSFVEETNPVSGEKKAVAVIDLEQARELGKLHLLKKFREDKDGSRAIELHDPQAALGQLGRYHGLFLDKTALTDPTGKHPAPIIYLPSVDHHKPESEESE